MGTEIERKFLTRSSGWRDGARSVYCVQGYLQREKNCVVRVRLMDDKGFLTIKGARGQGLAHPEFEYAIPAEDARFMLDHLAHKPLVEKRRWFVADHGALWEVDEFFGENSGLVVAEIELAAEDAPFVKPEWLGEEVTDDPRYANTALSHNPYTRWKE